MVSQLRTDPFISVIHSRALNIPQHKIHLYNFEKISFCLTARTLLRRFSDESVNGNQINFDSLV